MLCRSTAIYISHILLLENKCTLKIIPLSSALISEHYLLSVACSMHSAITQPATFHSRSTCGQG
jgi:nitrite reductase/ring-hydroxylating ferredoxin subunit